MINKFAKRVNLDSYSESEGYVGYVDLSGGQRDSLFQMADFLVRSFAEDCFISSLHVDSKLKENLTDFGLTYDFYERFIEPLLGEKVLALADYSNWSENDSELLRFNIFCRSIGNMVESESVYRLLYLYLACEHYLLFGHAFFVQENFACYLSDEGVGCISFDEYGVNKAASLLHSLSTISGGNIILQENK